MAATRHHCNTSGSIRHILHSAQPQPSSLDPSGDVSLRVSLTHAALVGVYDNDGKAVRSCPVANREESGERGDSNWRKRNDHDHPACHAFPMFGQARARMRLANTKKPRSSFQFSTKWTKDVESCFFPRGASGPHVSVWTAMSDEGRPMVVLARHKILVLARRE